MNKLKKYALSSLYDMSSGISSTKEQAGHGSPFVSFSTVFNNYFLPDDLPDLMDTSAKEQEIYSIKKGDILITRTSETIDELAMSCVATKDYPGATFSGFTKRLRPKTQGIAYYKYMAFYLRSAWFRKAVTNNAFMTLRASFNEDIFSFLNVYLPDYDVQVRIGDFLYSIEQKIDVNKRIGVELEDMAKTLYDYWFTQFDFPNEEGKPYRSSGGVMEWNQQLKREIPKGWVAKSISSLCDILSGYSFLSATYSDKGKYKLITIKNVQDTGINLDVDNHIECLPENIPEFCKLSYGDILMSLTGNVGRVGIMYTKNCLLNQRVALIRPKQSYLSGYLYILFRSAQMRTLMENIATGTSQKNLSPVDTGKILIPYDEKIVDRFCDTINVIIDKITFCQKENHELTELRDWLLPMLMNGQATVE